MLPGVGYGLTIFFFPVKRQRVNILGFIGNVVCAEVTQLKHPPERILIDNS